MRRAALVFVGILAAGAFAVASDRTASQTQLIQRLNGSPTLLGTVITDGGTSVNGCTTVGTAFDAGMGDMIVSVCVTDHYMKTGTCSTSATTNSLPIASGEKVYTLLTDSEMTIAFLPADAGVAGSCRLYHLR